MILRSPAQASGDAVGRQDVVVDVDDARTRLRVRAAGPACGAES